LSAIQGVGERTRNHAYSGASKIAQHDDEIFHG